MDDHAEVQADRPFGCRYCVKLGPKARARLGTPTNLLGVLRKTCMMMHGRPSWIMPWAKLPAHLGCFVLGGEPALHVACLFLTSVVRLLDVPILTLCTLHPLSARLHIL